MSAEHVPHDDEVPECPCGAKRLFEFQVKYMLNKKHIVIYKLLFESLGSVRFYSARVY